MLGRFASSAEGGLHPKHRLMNYHKFFVDNVAENDIVLDVGCGNGALSYDIARKARFVEAVEKEEKNIKICREKYSRENIKYVMADINDYVTERKISLIILSNVLEHIDDRRILLKRLGSISSRIFIRAPLITRDWIALYKKELGLQYMLDKSHKIEYTIEEFIREIEEGGFEIQKYSVQFGEIWAAVVKKD